MPELASPIKVISGTIALDGGSRSIEVEGAKGRRLFIGVRAVSGTTKTLYPLTVVNYPKILPLPYSTPLGGDYERTFMKQLETWSSETECEGFKQAYERIGKKSIFYTCKQVGDLYPVYCILMSRMIR